MVCLSLAVHRLDRLTSGLLILARSIHRAQQLELEIRERKVAKEYVCRVQGEFPEYGNNEMHLRTLRFTWTLFHNTSISWCRGVSVYSETF